MRQKLNKNGRFVGYFNVRGTFFSVSGTFLGWCSCGETAVVLKSVSVFCERNIFVFNFFCGRWRIAEFCNPKQN